MVKIRKYGEEDVLSNIRPSYMILMKYSNSGGQWLMKGNSYGFAYDALWVAKRYGLPHWLTQGRDCSWCIMDMSKGEIVWRSWEND